jgi:hypothetical protein
MDAPDPQDHLTMLARAHQVHALTLRRYRALCAQHASTMAALRRPGPWTRLPWTGYLCEQCLDAPAVALVPAPWGGDMGICGARGGLPPAVPAATWDAVPACLICAQPPGPDEDAMAYVHRRGKCIFPVPQVPVTQGVVM